jgi:hypothetical protein
MEKYNIKLKLFYIRTLKSSKYKHIPDLDDKNFDKFIKQKKIIQKLFDDFNFLFENMFDSHKITNKKYNKTTKTIFFDLQVKSSSIKEIKDILFNNSLEDSLYEDIDSIFTINDANKYFKLNEDNSLFEIGVIDYRKKTNIDIVKQ